MTNISINAPQGLVRNDDLDAATLNAKLRDPLAYILYAFTAANEICPLAWDPTGSPNIQTVVAQPNGTHLITPGVVLVDTSNIADGDRVYLDPYPFGGSNIRPGSYLILPLNPPGGYKLYVKANGGVNNSPAQSLPDFVNSDRLLRLHQSFPSFFAALPDGRVLSKDGYHFYDVLVRLQNKITDLQGLVDAPELYATLAATFSSEILTYTDDGRDGNLDSTLSSFATMRRKYAAVIDYLDKRATINYYENSVLVEGPSVVDADGSLTVVVGVEFDVGKIIVAVPLGLAPDLVRIELRWPPDKAPDLYEFLMLTIAVTADRYTPFEVDFVDFTGDLVALHSEGEAMTLTYDPQEIRIQVR